MLNNTEIQFNIEVWEEGNMYVSYAPQLDVSSCGKTIKEARDNIQEAVALFFEETKKMGTFNQVLEESGFLFKNGWKSPEMISFEKVKMVF
ncbi:type II toxin-antitoxin system HicB family antitoxin [Patescibacteria group bacterium]